MAETGEADCMFMDLENESQDLGPVAPPAAPQDDAVGGGVFTVPAIRATQVAAWLAEKYDLDPAPLRDPLQTFIIRRRRTGQRKSELSGLQAAADRELGRMEHALPSISTDAQVRLLTSHGFDHSRAIVEVVRSKLEPRVVNACGDNMHILEKAIKRAFRRAVVAKVTHPCLEAVKTLNTVEIARDAD